MSALAQRPLTPQEWGRARYARVRDFMQRHVYIADGPRARQPMRLLPAQDDFLSGVYGRVRADGRRMVRRAIHSCGRKNGKTAFISGLVQVHLFGPEAMPNAQLYSAARSRDQASLIFNYAVNSIRLNPRLDGLVSISDATKIIRGTLSGSTFKALSSEAKTAHGLNPGLVIHDELGQVVGPEDPFFDALETATGAQDEPLSIIISTQAASDADLLSVLIDDAIANGDETTFIQLFTVAAGADIYDEDEWYKANYALGVYRSLEEMRVAAAQAKRLPNFENRFRNLYLNQRVSLLSNLIPAGVWRENAGEPSADWFQAYPVHVGIDLSTRTDLTAAVLAVRDPDTGCIGLRTYAYTPVQGLEERARHDRAPYPLWVAQGHLIAVPGRAISYDYVIEHLMSVTKGMDVVTVNYDRWGIERFQKEAERFGFGDVAEWRPVGQGFKDMTRCLEGFELTAIDALIRHGGNPVLTSAAMGSATVKDPAGNRKLEKSKSSTRIDAMIAAVMAVDGCINSEAINYDIQSF